MNLYSVFDNVAKEGGALFDAKNDEIAIRKFEAVINNQIRPVKTVSVSDFELRLVGSFDPETLLITQYAGDEGSFKIICDGSEVNSWEPDPVQDKYQQLVDALVKQSMGKSPVEEFGPQLPLKPKKKHFWSK